MPVMSNFLVKDDATTPKEWILVPVTDTPFPQWRAEDPLLPIIAQPRLSMTIDKTKPGMKITSKLEVPVLETLGASGTAAGYVAPPKVAHTITSIMTMFVDDRTTIADRTNVLRMHVGVLQGASSTTNTGSNSNAAAGDVWKASTRDGMTLYTKAVLPS